MTITPRIAGIELGGTKCIAVLGDSEGRSIAERVCIPTTTPEETLGLLSECLKDWGGKYGLAALGVASFGPIGLKATNGMEPGVMLPTPKPGWTGARILAGLSVPLGCTAMIDTDVNGAAMAEYEQGAGRGCDVLCYITIGTGVGGGLVIRGRPVHGALHPEIGHLRLRRFDLDEFGGTCPFHGDCIEGLVSGPALAARFGSDPATFSDNDPRWDHVASDIAELAAAILLTVSAQKILVGGGVGIARPQLLRTAGRFLVDRYGPYLPFLRQDTVSEILRPAGLGDEAGPLGALALARLAMNCGN